MVSVLCTDELLDPSLMSSTKKKKKEVFSRNALE